MLHKLAGTCRGYALPHYGDHCYGEWALLQHLGLAASSSTIACEGIRHASFRLCGVLIDCKTSDVDEAARNWGEALGRPVDLKHPGSRGSPARK
jgi:hypothetical protein